MKTALYGRIVFGAAAVLFGVIALMWHDADTWQNLQHIWSLPFGTVIGGCLMTAQIAGGMGIRRRQDPMDDGVCDLEPANTLPALASRAWAGKGKSVGTHESENGDSRVK